MAARKYDPNHYDVPAGPDASLYTPPAPFAAEVDPKVAEIAKKDPTILEYVKAFGAGALQAYIGDQYETANEAAQVAPDAADWGKTAAFGTLAGLGIGAGTAGIGKLLSKVSTTGKVAAAGAGAGGLSYMAHKEGQKRQETKDPRFELPQQPQQGQPKSDGNLYELAAQRDPVIKQLLDKRNAIMQTAAADRERLTKQYSVEAGRGHAGPLAAGIQTEIGKLDPQLQQALAPIDEQLKEKIKPYLPFNQAHPDLSAALPLATFLAPAAGGAVTKALGRRTQNMTGNAMRQATSQFEKQFDRGNVGKASQRFEEVQSHLDAAGKPKGAVSRALHNDEVIDTAAPTVAGATIGAELSLAPHQYNRANTLPGTPEHENAEEKLKTPLSTAAPSALTGGLSAFTGTHVLPSVRRKADPNIKGQGIVNKVNKAGGVPEAMKKDTADQMSVDAMRKQQQASAPAQDGLLQKARNAVFGKPAGPNNQITGPAAGQPQLPGPGKGGGQMLPHGKGGGATISDLHAHNRQAKASRDALYANVGRHQGVQRALQDVATKKKLTPRSFAASLRSLYPDGRVDGVRITDKEAARILKRLGLL